MTERVGAHSPGMIYTLHGQRDRAVNEYNHAIRTKDNTQARRKKRPSI